MKTLALALLMLISICRAQQPFSPNYDESKVLPYTLPDVLKTINNVEINSKQQWEKIRRPEILKLFEDNVYGQMPQDYDSLTFTTTNQNDTAMNGKAKLKELALTKEELLAEK